MRDNVRICYDSIRFRYVSFTLPDPRMTTATPTTTPTRNSQQQQHTHYTHTHTHIHTHTQEHMHTRKRAQRRMQKKRKKTFKEEAKDQKATSLQIRVKTSQFSLRLSEKIRKKQEKRIAWCARSAALPASTAAPTPAEPHCSCTWLSSFSLSLSLGAI